MSPFVLLLSPRAGYLPAVSLALSMGPPPRIRHLLYNIREDKMDSGQYSTGKNGRTDRNSSPGPPQTCTWGWGVCEEAAKEEGECAGQESESREHRSVALPALSNLGRNSSFDDTDLQGRACTINRASRAKLATRLRSLESWVWVV